MVYDWLFFPNYHFVGSLLFHEETDSDFVEYARIAGKFEWKAGKQARLKIEPARRVL